MLKICKDTKNKCFIYCIENKVNNKKYIGKTINFEERKRRHFYSLKNNNHHNIHLQRSYNKYGSNNFNIYILTITTEEKAYKEEIKWISYYDTFKGDGYNLTPGGEGVGSGKDNPFFGKTHTKEAMDKILKANFNKKVSDETKKKISKARKGIKRKRETKIKISKTLKGISKSSYSNEKMSLINREKSPISYKDVYDILKLYFEKGLTQEKIGKKYNCSSTTIRRVIYLKHWTTESIINKK